MAEKLPVGVVFPCSWCGKEVVRTIWNQTTCGRTCAIKKYQASAKGKSGAKRAYEGMKRRGTCYHQKNPLANRIRQLRWLEDPEHQQQYRESRNRWARKRVAENKARYGRSLSPEDMRKGVQRHRVWQRLERGSVDARAKRWGNPIDERDLAGLERDVRELTEIRDCLQATLAGLSSYHMAARAEATEVEGVSFLGPGGQ